MPVLEQQIMQSRKIRLGGRKLSWRVIVTCGLVWGVLLDLSGPAAAGHDRPLERFQATQVEMGVPFRISLYAPDKSTAKGALDAAFARIQELNSILSDYDPDSELSRLSAASPTAEPVPISRDLWNVLERSQSLARKTDGAFDVTVGPYIRLWRRARRQKEMPREERLAEARAAVGYQLLVLDAKKRTALLKAPGMRLDLGGIAMGYAVDEAMQVIKSHDITRALIDASGDILAASPPPGKTGWTVSIMPFADDDSSAREILLAHAAVTSAGDAYQHVVLNGKRYSHIVDPKTGLGLTNQTAVIVIARDCLTADSLDTAASVLEPAAALKLIEATPGAAGLVARKVDGRIDAQETRNFAAYSEPEIISPRR
jgi:thiamine biosynthesis lipoprotein